MPNLRKKLSIYFSLTLFITISFQSQIFASKEFKIMNTTNKKICYAITSSVPESVNPVFKNGRIYRESRYVTKGWYCIPPRKYVTRYVNSRYIYLNFTNPEKVSFASENTPHPKYVCVHKKDAFTSAHFYYNIFSKNKRKPWGVRKERSYDKSKKLYRVRHCEVGGRWKIYKAYKVSTKRGYINILRSNKYLK